MPWRKITPLESLPPGARRSFAHGDLEVTLLRLDRPAPAGAPADEGDVADLVALRNRCPHANGRLGDGEVRGHEIHCPLHRWPFDLRTGATRRQPRLLATLYPVRVTEGWVEVDLPEEAPPGRPE